MGPWKAFRNLTPKILLYKGKGLLTTLLSQAPTTPSPAQLLLTQKLGTGLVGAERLHLLPVLAKQAEPRRAGLGAVQLGRNVPLGLPPGRQGKAG